MVDGQSLSNGTVVACDMPSGYSDNILDCDDNNANAYDGATEIPNNGEDEDCDGSDSIEGETDCTDGIDNDSDGGADCDDSDCLLACIDNDGDGEPSIADGEQTVMMTMLQ